jgi:hypothetical protein
VAVCDQKIRALEQTADEEKKNNDKNRNNTDQEL